MFFSGSASGYQQFVEYLADVVAGQGLMRPPSIETAGSGYAVGDTLTMVGGTADAPGAAQLYVTSVDTNGGVVATHVINAGTYSTPPAGNMTSTGGSGTGAVFSGTFGTSNWEVLDEELPGGGHRELYLRSVLGSGSTVTNVYGGMRTYETGAARNIELAGFTGWTDGLAWASQPGISPGRSDSNGGAFMPLRDSSLNYYVSVQPHRIAGAIDMPGDYTATFYLGLVASNRPMFQPPGLSMEINAYPMYVAGCSSQFDETSTSTNYIGSVANPIAVDELSDGPGIRRNASGAWVTVKNTYPNFGSKFNGEIRAVTPCGMAREDPLLPEDTISTRDSTSWWAIADQSGVMSPSWDLVPTGGHTAVFQTTVADQDDPFVNTGELSGVYWCSGNRLPQPPFYSQTGDALMLFIRGGNIQEDFTWMALEVS